jgi:hypothetical protein
MTITGVNLTAAAGLIAAIGEIRRFSSPQKTASYVSLNPRVRQSSHPFGLETGAQSATTYAPHRDHTHIAL